MDVGRFGAVYAGAQKNLGVAGLTVVVVHEDLLGRAHPLTPTVVRYEAQAAAGSMANTPCTFAWYAAALVLEWVEDEGGVPAMAERARRRAAPPLRGRSTPLRLLLEPGRARTPARG